MGTVDLQSGNDVARSVFAGLPQRYDRLGALLSLGQDRRWRAELVRRAALARPGSVLDVATGPAGIAIAVARHTDAAVVGVDLNEPMLRAGVASVQRAALTPRVRLAVAQAERLPFRDETFDVVCFSYLLRYVDDPAATVAELSRCVRPGGLLVGLDFHVPPNWWWRAWWRLFTRLVLPAAGALTGGRPWYRVGRFLGPNIDGFYARNPRESLNAMWRDAGLDEPQWRLMSLGGGMVMSARKIAVEP
jgi:demethylmenaquinone methyltransferase / 2-methoxy-6-polyprenyl-1,4-benzoquinol methylase